MMPSAVLKRGLRSVARLALLAILAGCATLPNTPQQDYVWEMGRICDGLDRNWYLDGVKANGSYTIRGATNSIPGPDLPYFACMKEQFAARPYREWLKERTAPSAPDLVSSPKVEAATGAGPPIFKPTWTIGDQWSYRWESPRGKGALVWIVDRLETIDGAGVVVVRSGSREIFYRRADATHLFDKVNGVLEVRYVPPVALVRFPLQVGKTWTADYTREYPQAHREDRVLLDCRGVAIETVTVPAGTFPAVHMTCHHRLGGALSFELWYAEAVGNTIKERAVFSYGVWTRELVGFRYEARHAGSVSLDTPDTLDARHREYFNAVREKIRSAWVYPREAGETGVEGSTGLLFEIAKDGTLRDVRLKTPSGSEVLDQAAIAAVRASAPFPPVPDGIARGVLTINGSFRYQIRRD